MTAARQDERTTNQLSPCVQRLPLQDLLPGLLVVRVVDFDDVGHIFLAKVVLTPAPPATSTRRTVASDKEPTRILST